MLTISIIVGEFIVNGVSILIAKAMGTDDVVNILIQNAGWIGVICTILAVIKINDINLYCVSLSMSNVIESITGKNQLCYINANRWQYRHFLYRYRYLRQFC